MPTSRPHSEELFQFSQRIFKIEYIIIKLVLFASSMYGLFKLAKAEFHLNEDSTQASVVNSSRPIQSP